VVALQEAVWGADGETVPASVLFVSAKRGGILIGVSDGDAAASDLVGFVWSMPGLRDDGVRTHWSHMLGVRSDARGRGIGERLKLAQRGRAIAQGAALVEWTFDPLQAANAHFNLHVLGAIGVGYGRDVYGAMAGPLHRGTPTDRLFVEWPVGEPHVLRRLAARSRGIVARAADVNDSPDLVRVVTQGAWLAPDIVLPIRDARRLLVTVPPRFTEMQQEATDLALVWRHTVRGVFDDAFARGYRALDFFLDPAAGGGRYLLARPDV
jgi:predicted GNAT superfamily acetyltransferase